MNRTMVLYHSVFVEFKNTFKRQKNNRDVFTNYAEARSSGDTWATGHLSPTLGRTDRRADGQDT